MPRHRGLLLAFLALASLPSLGQQPQAPAAMSTTASQYLDQALDLMQRNALHRAEIDWSAVRTAAALHAQGARTPSEIYPAIYFALTQLHEHHSFLQLPDTLSPEQKRSADEARGAILGPWQRQVLVPPVSPFHLRTQPEGHLLLARGRTFALIVVPACSGRSSRWADNAEDFRAYAVTLHAAAARLQAARPSGWIVDLRGNGGGNMWPMLAGIGLLVGEGVAGYFVSGESSVAWSYRHGEAQLQHTNMNAFRLEPPLTLQPLPPIAVLIDSGTASSGEAIAIAFKGRARTRFFGSQTFGLASANAMFPLSDGATLFLNDAVDADRNHQRYEGGVEPDVVVDAPTRLPLHGSDPEAGPNADPVIEAALRWLVAMP